MKVHPAMCMKTRKRSEKPGASLRNRQGWPLDTIDIKNEGASGDVYEKKWGGESPAAG
jgi:hypothetical protein